MKSPPRIAEKKSRASATTAVKEAACPCADIVTGLILCKIPQFTEVMPASNGVVVSLEKTQTMYIAKQFLPIWQWCFHMMFSLLTLFMFVPCSENP